MEVQTYMLCQSLSARKDGAHDGQTLCAHMFWPLDGIFPFQFEIVQYMCFRKRTLTAEKSKATIRIVDADKKPVEDNGPIEALVQFGSHSCFSFLYGKLPLNIPEPGKYRIEISTDEHTVHYDFVVYPEKP